jgi:hypothetical protein
MELQLTAAEAARLLRRQRHSFLNHLQVISGWLQLDKPERAKRYVEEVARHAAAEGELLGQLSPELALLVAALLLEAETYGVEIIWQAEPGGYAIDAAVLAKLQGAAAAAFQALAALPENERRLCIGFGPGNQFWVHRPEAPSEG